MTAVEFLYKVLEGIRMDYNQKRISAEQAINSKAEALESAKEMEKQQIIDARVNGVAEGIDIGSNPITEDISKNHEIYYNETYNK
jgi:hypothetical protein